LPHEAADNHSCRDYGVSDFQDVMLKRGVKSEGPQGNDNETVEVMVSVFKARSGIVRRVPRLGNASRRQVPLESG